MAVGFSKSLAFKLGLVCSGAGSVTLNSRIDSAATEQRSWVNKLPTSAILQIPTLLEKKRGVQKERKRGRAPSPMVQVMCRCSKCKCPFF